MWVAEVAPVPPAQFTALAEVREDIVVEALRKPQALDTGRLGPPLSAVAGLTGGRIGRQGRDDRGRRSAVVRVGREQSVGELGGLDQRPSKLAGLAFVV